MENTKRDTIEGAFSRREWLMVIALVVVVEAWVLNMSYSFQSEEAVINYVSFAATIASLLLAVIAIIYGFYQSDGQQKSAAAISSQIDLMRAVQKELNVASAGISQQLAGMTITATDLKNLSELLDGAHAALGTIQGDIGGLRAQHLSVQEAVAGMRANAMKQAGHESARPGDAGAKREFIKYVLKSASASGELMIVALFGLIKHRDAKAADWIKFVETHYIDPLSSTEEGNFIAFKYSVVGLEIIVTHRALGLLNWELPDKSSPLGFKVDPAHFDLIEEFANLVLAKTVRKAGATAILASFE